MAERKRGGIVSRGWRRCLGTRLALIAIFFVQDEDDSSRGGDEDEEDEAITGLQDLAPPPLARNHGVGQFFQAWTRR
jgi:hypothetical protein